LSRSELFFSCHCHGLNDITSLHKNQIDNQTGNKRNSTYKMSKKGHFGDILGAFCLDGRRGLLIPVRFCRQSKRLSLTSLSYIGVKFASAFFWGKSLSQPNLIKFDADFELFMIKILTFDIPCLIKISYIPGKKDKLVNI
jgi:hypothetical protein